MEKGGPWKGVWIGEYSGAAKGWTVYKTSGFSKPFPGSSLPPSGPSLSPGSKIPPALCPSSAILLLFSLSSSLPCCIPLVEILYYLKSPAQVSFFIRKDFHSPLIVILFFVYSSFSLSLQPRVSCYYSCHPVEVGQVTANKSNQVQAK